MKRSIALNKVVEEFQDLTNPPSSSQVQQKLTRLRCYYTAENNKVERSKKSGGDTDSVYVPGWKFFESLQFLRDFLVIRTTKSTHEASSNDSSAYTMSTLPFLKFRKELNKKEDELNEETMMVIEDRSLEKIESRSRHSGINAQQKDIQTNEDKKLSDMVYTMLQSIPEGMPKAMLRLEIQQKIIQVKFGFQGIGNEIQWAAQNLSNNLVPPIASTPSHSSSKASALTDSLPIHR